MRVIIFIMLGVLLLGFFLNHFIIKDQDSQWQVYFIANDAKAFLISLALCVVTWRTKNLPFAFSALLICSYDLLLQCLDIKVKGDWADIVWELIVGLTVIYLLWKVTKK